MGPSFPVLSCWAVAGGWRHVSSCRRSPGPGFPKRVGDPMPSSSPSRSLPTHAAMEGACRAQGWGSGCCRWGLGMGVQGLGELEGFSWLPGVSPYTGRWVPTLGGGPILPSLASHSAQGVEQCGGEQGAPPPDSWRSGPVPRPSTPAWRLEAGPGVGGSSASAADCIGTVSGSQSHCDPQVPVSPVRAPVTRSGSAEPSSQPMRSPTTEVRFTPPSCFP